MVETLNTTHMQKIELIKRVTPSGKNVYTARHNGKKVFDTAPTVKNYIAIVIDKFGHACCRFERIEDIGVGYSLHTMFAQIDPYIAIIPDQMENVRLPKKQPFNEYHIIYGRWESKIVEQSEAGARDQAKSEYYKSRKISVPADMFYIRTVTPLNYKSDKLFEYRGYTNLKAHFNGLDHSPGVNITHNKSRQVAQVKYIAERYYSDLAKFEDARDKALATAQLFKNAPNLLHQLQTAYNLLLNEKKNFESSNSGQAIKEAIERAVAPLQNETI